MNERNREARVLKRRKVTSACFADQHQPTSANTLEFAKMFAVMQCVQFRCVFIATDLMTRVNMLKVIQAHKINPYSFFYGTCNLRIVAASAASLWIHLQFAFRHFCKSQGPLVRSNRRVPNFSSRVTVCHVCATARCFYILHLLHARFVYLNKKGF